jgi:hypothetical protein
MKNTKLRKKNRNNCKKEDETRVNSFINAGALSLRFLLYPDSFYILSVIVGRGQNAATVDARSI